MDAARDFTGRKETRDRVTGRIKHLSLGIDLHAAHRVVNSRLNLDGKERGGLHSLRHIGTAERILARSFPCRISLERGFKLSRRHVHRLGDFGDGIALDGQTHRNVGVHELGGLAGGIIPEDPGEAAGLLEFGSRNHIARQEFIGEALAFGVDQNAAVAAHAFRNQRAVRRGRRMRLNLLHIHERCAGVFGKDNAVTRCAGLIGRRIALEFGLILDEHILIGAEAAGGEHHGLGINRIDLAVLGRGFDARYTAVLHNDFGSARLRADVHLAVFSGLPEHTDDFRADGGAVCRTVSAGILGAARAPNGIEVSTQ